jgi:cell division protein FtsL
MVEELLVQDRFNEPLDLEDYPLDTQRLSINVENTLQPRTDMAYQPDMDQSNFDSLLKRPGWIVESLTSETLIHEYNSDFGITGATVERSFSTVHFIMQIRRSPNLFAWKLLLPLVLVLISNWLALLLHPSFVEIRTGMCATALLTTVFLQLSSIDGSLVNGLVLIDQLYVLAYVLVVMTFSLVVRDNNRIRQFTASEKHVQIEEEQLLEMGKETNIEARKELIKERDVKEEAVVRSIRT